MHIHKTLYTSTKNCFKINSNKREEAISVGEKAVDFAVNHEVGMVTIVRESTTPYQVSYQLTPLKDVANAIKTVPLEWINEERNGVTQEMVDYVRPLIDENEINVEDDKVTYKRNRNCKRKLERIFIRRRWNYR